jgi:abequosyltransferase
MTRPLFSVIVPTYNRPQHLAELLDSVLAQDFADWEMIVGEDCSPARAQVEAIMKTYAAKSDGRMRVHLHTENLGYDRGVRGLIEQARGRFLFVMGDDDFVAPGAFRKAADVIDRYPNVGLILRAFAWFVDTPSNVVQVTRYYPGECSFPAGRAAILACFRRLVVMSGLVMDRDLAHACATDKWDGSLFYQHWIGGTILAQKDAVYVPDLFVYFRRGSPSMWGMAKAERHLYTPGVQPPHMHVKMVRWQMDIAADLEQRWNLPLVDDLRRDYANYAFPIFSGQAHLPWRQFFAYYREMGRLGLNRYAMYHAWFWAISILGVGNVDRLLQWMRRVAGYTPNISRAARARVSAS